MNILTFDIEDWWIYNYYQIGNPDDYLPRLNNYLDKILEILERRNFQATFFFLGEVARQYPNVLKKVFSKGHHIGCHSYSHQFLSDLTPEEFDKDTKLALKYIEDVIGIKVDSYRAPAYSISEKNKWAFKILAENGIKNDCSIYPSKRSIGGFSSFNERKPVIIRTKEYEIREYPMPLIKITGKELAYSGGGYFRLIPYYLIKKNTLRSDYVMTYFHIKDFDYKQDRKIGLINNESKLSRYFKDYYGIKGSFKKFNKYINDFDFISLKQASEKIDWNSVKTIDLD